MIQPRGQASELRDFAMRHGVSVQTARKNREADTVDWRAYKADLAAVAAANATSIADASPASESLGIYAEIDRARQECAALARRVTQAVADGLLDQEYTLSKMLDARRESLRRMEKDNPKIQASSGESVPTTHVVQYAAKIVTLIRTLPSRLASIMPESLSGDVRARAQQEIDELCEIAAAIKPTETGE